MKKEETIKICEIISGKETYPNWSTGTTYPLKFELDEDEIIIYYIMTKTIMNKVYSRKFPKEIKLTPSFCWALGFIKGEGMNSLNKSSYHRFGVTNKNPKLISYVLEELDKSNLLKKEKIPDRSFQILHWFSTPREVVNYWSNKLNVPKEKINPYNDKNSLKRTKFGTCHFYITDVLLRRIIDIISEKIFDNE